MLSSMVGSVFVSRSRKIVQEHKWYKLNHTEIKINWFFCGDHYFASRHFCPHQMLHLSPGKLYNPPKVADKKVTPELEATLTCHGILIIKEVCHAEWSGFPGWVCCGKTIPALPLEAGNTFVLCCTILCMQQLALNSHTAPVWGSAVMYSRYIQDIQNPSHLDYMYFCGFASKMKDPLPLTLQVRNKG